MSHRRCNAARRTAVRHETSRFSTAVRIVRRRSNRTPAQSSRTRSSDRLRRVNCWSHPTSVTVTPSAVATVSETAGGYG
ncbi:hypothetical protein NJ7G_1945 [Natrinema sp. J7-2]|nr:hypothetical protein NJ7G_1945 [Natrinema sp. J7-2]